MGRNLGKPLPDALARIAEVLGERDLGAIAEKLGFPYGTVRNWHQRGSVSLAGLQAAAKRSGRSIEFFLEGAQDGSKKFTPSGLQVNQMRGGDAFGLEINENVTGDVFGQGQKVTGIEREVHPRPYAPPAEGGAGPAFVKQNVVRYDAAKVDPELLSGVLAAVLDELRLRGLELPTEKLAELVSLVYEDLSESQVDGASRPDQAQRTAKRYLRLVA